MARETAVMTPGWEQHARDATGRFISEKLTAFIADDARAGCPVKSGKLLESIKHVGNKVSVGGIGLEYWFYVEYGTLPHFIRPVHAKALRWEDDTGVHYAKLVWHPGTQATNFMRNALYRFRTSL
jgi:hypothetical protein